MPTAIWTLQRFQESTNPYTGGGFSRDNDPNLRMIDGLIREFHQTVPGSRQVVCLGKLLIAIDDWLKTTGTAFGPPTRAPRRPAGRRTAAMTEFRRTVEARLQEETRIHDPAALHAWIARTFGCAVTPEMAEQDRTTRAIVHSAADLDNYRLTIINGIVFSRRWWWDGVQLAPFDSADLYAAHHPKTGLSASTSRPDFTGFVLTLDGEFYSGLHTVGYPPSKPGRFHSAYTGGRQVHCAGEIEVREGGVTHINNKSGHYLPSTFMLRDAVELLSIRGVKLGRMKVTDFARDDSVNGETFGAQEFLDRYPPRYYAGDNESREDALRRRLASGAEDIIIAPLFRQPLVTEFAQRYPISPESAAAYTRAIDKLERTLVEDLGIRASSANFRVATLRSHDRARLNFNEEAAPGFEALRAWRVDTAIISSLRFDVFEPVPPFTLSVTGYVESLHYKKFVEVYIGPDLLTRPAAAMLKLGPCAEEVVQALVTRKNSYVALAGR